MIENKVITNNVILMGYDTFQIVELIKEVDKLQEVYEGCTLQNDFKIVKEKIINECSEFTDAFNYFKCELKHNYVNWNKECAAYEVHEYVLKCYDSEYEGVYNTATTYILNGGFIVE